MAERELDALVVRAPDNVLYLTNFWGMKGYDAVVFPPEGEPTLICLERLASRCRADGVDDRGPALPRLRRDATRGRPASARSTSPRQISSELRPGRDRAARSARRPPTAWSASRRPTRRRGSTRSRRRGRDAAACNEARAIKTEQEVERMRLANEIAAGAMEHVQARAPARDDGRAQVGAMWHGFVHGAGHRAAKGKVELALRLLARLVGPGDPHVHGDRRAGRSSGGRADALRDLGLRRRLLVRPHEEPRPGRARRALRASSSEQLTGVYDDAVDFLQAGREPRRARPARPRRASPRLGYPGQPSASDLPRRRRPRARAALRAPGRRRRIGEADGARNRAGHATGPRAAAFASRTTS